MKRLLYMLLALLSSASAYSQMLFSDNLTMTIDSTKTLQGSLMPFLFLSPRNPVFTIFSLVVLYYESTTYIPFLYQSSKIRISFL